MVVPGSVEVRFRQSEVRHASPIPEPGRGYAPNTAIICPARSLPITARTLAKSIHSLPSLHEPTSP